MKGYKNLDDNVRKAIINSVKLADEKLKQMDVYE